MCINHQPCTSTCINLHINLYHTTSTNLYHTMYQPCIKTCTNHVHQPIPYHASTMYHTSTCTNITKTCTSYMYQEYASHHAPNMCLKHIPMPQQDTKGITITSSTSNQDVPQTMCLKHVPTSINHVPRDTIKHVPYHSYTIHQTIFQVSKMWL
jgi:hypothetical protein